ncbi:MAG TPA: hypothetical protein VHX37_10985 [Acidobacteriaceae bacterium]|jgi:hypothetical protein|nr:hypothetical protein [Acidobacteriaceae bacterium]
MTNPWESLTFDGGSYLLETDRASIEIFNKQQRDEDRRVVASAIPEPFIGDPSQAKVVLLGLSPGYSVNNLSHSWADFRDGMFLNLRHGKQDFPFYPLNPAFRETGAGQWWRKIVGRLRSESGLHESTFAKRLMVIEWFPYPSRRAALPVAKICDSQEYTFDLAARMLKKEGVVVVGMRSRAHWVGASSEFRQVPFLVNKQRPFVTRGNMEGGLFDRILEAMRVS